MERDTCKEAALLGAASSDGEAFAAFYRLFERQVLGFFMRGTARPELAADLTAETFSRALESLAPTISPRGGPTSGCSGSFAMSWARAIAGVGSSPPHASGSTYRAWS